MLPEVEAYFNALNGRKLDTERGRVYRDYPVPDWDHTMSPEKVAEYFKAEDARTAALRALDKAHKEREANAYQDLLKSKDPVVRWLLTDQEIQREYPQFAEVVLRALPMTREELEDFGERQGWGAVYGRMLRRAETEGVLPERVPDLADIDPLVHEIANAFSLRERRVRAIVKKHLPSILASARSMEAQQSQESGQAPM
ncbi:hypothetical protein [Nonomuraea sp. NPDC049400]|uniref:hypothetical protein n=1 Tax=Nonomuraea sp. NPDC049400 TaxID=3364352 RepID=UPI00379CE3DB